MSLLPCPDCGNPVSTRATSCPKCGYPFDPGVKTYQDKNSGKGGGLTFWGVVGAVILAIIIMSLD